MVLNVFIGEHSLVVQNVIDEDAVAVRLVVVVAVLKNLPAFVDDSLMEISEKVALPLVFVIARRQLKNGIRINDRLVLQ